MRLLPLLLVLGAAGCASQQIATDTQQAYFRCRGIIVDGAANNLQRAGYETDWRDGDAAIETKWTTFTIDERGDRSSMLLRFVVEASNDGVEFTIFERSRDARGEAPWRTITEDHTNNVGVRRLLEKIRRDVCGTSGSFFSASG